MIVSIAVSSLTASPAVLGQWSNDPTVNTPVCTAPNKQKAPQMTTDGVNGCIIAWFDARDSGSTAYDIYAQRFNASGIRQWALNGVALCSANYDQYNPQLCSDDSGGAIIVWTDSRNVFGTDIYAQRINASGMTQWTANGVVVCTDPLTKQGGAAIVRDGAGGAIISWQDNRNGTTNYDIYAQRINANGVRQWIVSGDSNGVAICAASNNQLDPNIVSDDAGGAIIAWEDYRNSGLTPAADIYAQRVNASGTTQWVANGATLSLVSNWGAVQLHMASDGSAGAIATFTGPRIGDDNHLYAQRINSSGSTPWTPPSNIGVNVGYTFGSFYGSPGCVSDGAGGAIISASDISGGIQAQRVDGSGNLIWNGGSPLLVYNESGAQFFAPVIAQDGSGGAIIAWDRLGGDTTEIDIYAQRVDPSGKLLWLSSGLPISYAHFDQGPPLAIVEAAPGAAIVTWEDSRNNPSYSSPDRDIYCNLANAFVSISTIYDLSLHAFDNTGISIQVNHLNGFPNGLKVKVVKYPKIPPPPPPFNHDRIAMLGENVYWTIDAMDMPPGGSFMADVTFDYSPPEAPEPFPWRVRVATRGSSAELFDVASLVEVRPQPKEIVVKDVDHFSEWVLCTVPETTAQYALNDRWNLVSVPLVVSDYSKNALYSSAISNAFAYEGSYVVKPTLENGRGFWLKFNGAQINPITGTQLPAVQETVSTGWNLIGSLSQSIPVTQVTSDPAGIVTSQFFGYQGIYQATNTIEPGNAYWVKVNQSGRLTLSSFSIPPGLTAIRIVPTTDLPPSPPESEISNPKSAIPMEFSLEQNYPNPFNPLTVIRYQLIVNSFVTLKVYDLLGQEVATLVDGIQDAGYKSVSWNATNVPSGVYICRLTAGSFVEVRRMIMTK